MPPPPPPTTSAMRFAEAKKDPKDPTMAVAREEQQSLTPHGVPARLFVAAAPTALAALPPDGNGNSSGHERAAFMYSLVAFLRSWDPQALEPSLAASSLASQLASELPWPMPPGLLTVQSEQDARRWLGYGIDQTAMATMTAAQRDEPELLV